MDNSGNRKILNSFDMSLEEYLSLDKDVRIAYLRCYWDKKMNEHESFKKENIKTKVLSILKRK